MWKWIKFTNLNICQAYHQFYYQHVSNSIDDETGMLYAHAAISSLLKDDRLDS